MLISRGHAVGSIHWAQLAKYEAEVVAREAAEALAHTRAEAKAKAPKPEPESEPGHESELLADPAVLEPVEFVPDPVVPEPLVESKPRPGPGRPRKDSYR